MARLSEQQKAALLEDLYNSDDDDDDDELLHDKSIGLSQSQQSSSPGSSPGSASVPAVSRIPGDEERDGSGGLEHEGVACDETTATEAGAGLDERALRKAEMQARNEANAFSFDVPDPSKLCWHTDKTSFLPAFIVPEHQRLDKLKPNKANTENMIEIMYLGVGHKYRATTFYVTSEKSLIPFHGGPWESTDECANQPQGEDEPARDGKVLYPENEQEGGGSPDGDETTTLEDAIPQQVSLPEEDERCSTSTLAWSPTLVEKYKKYLRKLTDFRGQDAEYKLEVEELFLRNLLEKVRESEKNATAPAKHDGDDDEQIDDEEEEEHLVAIPSPPRRPAQPKPAAEERKPAAEERPVSGTTGKKKQSLRAGDVVKYYPPTRTAAGADVREAMILNVYPGADDYEIALQLHNGTHLARDSQILLVKRWLRNKQVDVPGADLAGARFQEISHCTLNKSNNGKFDHLDLHASTLHSFVKDTTNNLNQAIKEAYSGKSPTGGKRKRSTNDETADDADDNENDLE